MFGIEDLSPETLAIIIAAMPELRRFIAAHDDCIGIEFSRARVRCKECVDPQQCAFPIEPAMLTLCGGARAAITRVRLGKPNKRVHRKAARERLAAQRAKMA